MRYAVYDDETMELITVIKLRPNWVKLLLERQRLKVPVCHPVEAMTIDEQIPTSPKTMSVDIRAVRLRGPNGIETLVLTVSDRENALLTKSKILPGQREHLEQAFNAGVARAFEMLVGRP